MRWAAILSAFIFTASLGAAEASFNDSTYKLLDVSQFVQSGDPDDTLSFQRAEYAASSGVNSCAGGIGFGIYYPPKNYTISSTITMCPGVTHQGAGRTMTNINGGSVSGWVFQLLNANGTNEVQGPSFFDMNIGASATGGIRYNSITGGFTDDGSSQAYMVRPNIQRVTIEGTQTSGQICLQMNKTFDAVISNGFLELCGTNLDLEGSDITSVTDSTRFVAPVTQNILINRRGTFGSSTQIDHADILEAGTAGSIVSSDLDLILKDSLIEITSGSYPSCINLTNGTLNAKIEGNRIQCAGNVTHWLQVDTDVVNLSVQNNYTSGATTPALFKSGAGVLYYENNSLIQNISHANNSGALDTGFPTNVQPVDIQKFPPNVLYVFSPQGFGPDSSGYGTCQIVNNAAFMLQAVDSCGNKNNLRFPIPSTYLGAFDVIALASATSGTPVLHTVVTDGGVFSAASDTTLSTVPQWYTLISNVTIASSMIVLPSNAEISGDPINLFQIAVKFHGT